jgi:hypothetical protein
MTAKAMLTSNRGVAFSRGSPPSLASACDRSDNGNDAGYLQKRHHFPAELLSNVAALGALFEAAAGQNP